MMKGMSPDALQYICLYFGGTAGDRVMKFQIVSRVLVTHANCITLPSRFIETRNFPRRRGKVWILSSVIHVCVLLMPSTEFNVINFFLP